MGTLTERIAQSSDPARIAFALRIEEKRAVLVRIFQPVQAVELLRVEHSITWRRYPKSKIKLLLMTGIWYRRTINGIPIWPRCFSRNQE